MILKGLLFAGIGVTGPGFAFVVVSRMFALGVPLWAIAAGAVWWATRKRDVAPRAEPAVEKEPA